MDIDRSYQISFLLGYFTGKYPNQTADDLLILVDQHFTDRNNPGVTKKELEFVKDLHAEIWFTLKLQGKNRKDLRKMAK